MKHPQPIPSDMSPVTRRLICADGVKALEFYKKAFGAVEYSRLVSDDGKLMHALFRIGGAPLMMGEESREYGELGPRTLKGSPVIIHLYVKDVDSFVDKAVKAGCKLTMPVDDQFWGDRYGKLEDPFGHQWSVATHIRDVSQAEMEQGMKNMPKPGSRPGQSAH